MSSHLLSQEHQHVLVDRFNDLINYVKSNFRHYQECYASINDTPIASLTELNKYPIQERKDLMKSSLIKDVLDSLPPFYFETSGTTGNPFPVIANLNHAKSEEFGKFLDYWMSLKSDEITKAIIALPFEMNPVGLKFFLALSTLGMMSIPAGVRTHLCPPKKVIDIINRLTPQLLIGRPMEILRYAEAQILEGKDPKDTPIKKIIFTGEIVSENKCKRISKMYGGAEVKGIYGLTELDSGGLLLCSKHKYKYHLPPMPYLMVEVLKDDLKTPVEDGEIGTIILTNTEKNYMPLVRYNTGDSGKLHVHCDCELNTPAIEIMGRKEDRLKGENDYIYPIQLENILFGHDEIASDYQILSHHGHVTLRLEINKPNHEEIQELARQVENEIHQKLHIPVTIEAYPFGKLANKLGIAKDKAGKVYFLDHCQPEEIEEKRQMNF